MTFEDKLVHQNQFLLGVELVSTRGTLAESKAGRTIQFSRDLAASPKVDWVSITDNAGGNPMLAPAALGRPHLEAGGDVVIHLSCKDFNRNGLESEAWHLASEGFHNLLVLTGDAAGKGIAGGAKQVFDIDSIGLLTLLQHMNEGLDNTRPGSKKLIRLAPTRFNCGAVVTNFKLHENELIPQLLKLEKKIEAGARWVINQVGYDARKMSELIVWMQQRGLGNIPLIGNVYVLNPAVARLFRSQRIPGVVISDELAEICENQASSEDKGRAYFRDMAARQVAIYRGLGYRGAYLGGVHSMAELELLLDAIESYEGCDWRELVPSLSYSRPGEFFFYERDAATGLADAQRVNADYLASLQKRPASANVTLNYRLSKFTHDLMFTPGKGLWKLGEKLCANSKDPMQGPGWMRSIEHAGKSLMFKCKDCGDCSLPDIAFLCPESSCAKNQRNGPCGGTRDGKCEVEDFECIWSRAYDRLKYEGREQELLNHAPVIQNQSLRGSSSWANTWLDRDHLANPINNGHPPEAKT
ncbi:MAG: methylenetetrahydrofolate reductase C-terminal domain-containing protein [Opitutales bacterium]|nr:methylenetetrahydrofolate reductase C-terminal domain-containing protein [Opitutales bacterium]